MAALAAHRAPQAFRLPYGEAGERHRHFEHLVLETTTPNVERSGSLEQWVVCVRTKSGSSRASGAGRRTDGRPALIGPGRRARPARSGRRGSRAVSAADSASAHGSRSGRRRPCRHADVLVRRLIVERDPREIDRLSVHSAICSKHSSTADSIPRPSRSILRKPASSTSPCPIGTSAARHRRRLDGTNSIERPRRDDHPAGVLRDVARDPPICARARRTRASSEMRASIRVGQRRQLVPTRLGCRPSGCASRSSFAEGRPSALPNRGSRRGVVGREAGDERGMLAAVFSVTPTISCSRMSRGKSRSMSGTDSSSRFRNRPSESSASTGSTCESPVR